MILYDEPLSKHTYYRIGGPARMLAIPKSLEDLRFLSREIQEKGLDFFILGAGSNVLASDSGFPGIVIKTGRLNLEIVQTSPECIRTGGSAMISTLLRKASQEGWGGLEFLTGIPGTVGGVVRMNGGTHLGEVADRLRKVEAFSLKEGNQELTVFEREQLRFQYRKNLFLPSGSVVWSAEWEARQDEPAKVKAVIDETLARRKATQPLDSPSCGSVFKNPKESGLSAWQVIDRLGLRGHRIGDAQFSGKHCNFILNLGGAHAADVRGLIDLAKSRAKAELGITLEEEVIYL